MSMRLMLVYIALSCAHTLVNAQHFTHPSVCVDLYQRIDTVNRACASSSSSNCSLSCAIEVIRLVQNSSCMSTADKLLDVYGDDTIEDGNASALREYARICFNNQTATELTKKIVGLRVARSILSASHAVHLNK